MSRVCHVRRRGQVLDREEARQRALGLRGRVDEAAGDPLAQRRRAEVDEPQLAGVAQEAVRQRLADLDPDQRANALS
jgi:hypothetical protein